MLLSSLNWLRAPGVFPPCSEEDVSSSKNFFFLEGSITTFPRQVNGKGISKFQSPLCVTPRWKVPGTKGVPVLNLFICGVQ